MRRRALLQAAGAACIGGLSGCIDSLAPPSDDEESPASSGTRRTDGWRGFGAGPHHAGYRPDGRGPDRGEVAWSAIGSAPTVLCSPTVADGTVYVGSAAARVHALDAASGEVEWEHDTRGYVETAPSVVDGTVYTASSDGVVYALSTGGDEEWTHETDHNLHTRAVAVADGTVFVGTAGTMPAVSSGDTDGSRASLVVALDADSGEKLWSHEGEEWFSGPAYGDGRVYVGDHLGNVLALDPESGEVLWSWRAPADWDDASHGAVLAPPTYADGTVFVGLHVVGALVALDAASGQLAWSARLDSSNVKSSPAVTEDRVYVGSYGSYGMVPDSGGEGEEAATTTTATEERGCGPPEGGSGTVGTLHAVARDDGSVTWRHCAPHDVRSSPAVVGDGVYVGGGDGLLAVAREDGSRRWRVSFGDFVDSSPAVADGRAFVGSADGSLYCVGEGDP